MKLVRFGVLRWVGRLGWDDWLAANMKGDPRWGFVEGWPERFSIRLWWLWKWRNDKIFNGRSLPVDQKIRWIEKQEMEIMSAFSKHAVMGATAVRWVDTYLSWTKPQLGYIKLNVDGSRCSRSGKAGCGGVFRDHERRWKGGFIASIGICSREEAEAWAVLHGLRLAVQMGLQQIIVESDSRVLIELLRNNDRLIASFNNLIDRCREELTGFLSVDFQHVYVYREQNKVADTLVKKALLGSRFVSVLTNAPVELEELINDDCLGVKFLRRIPANGADRVS